MSKSTDNSSKILFIMTGSIACYKACQVISRLVQGGHEVQVVASSAALQFVGNATLEGLSGKPVVSDMYAKGNVMDHIHLARWADLIVVAPATANYINKIAQGIGDDLLTTLFLAHDFKKPYLVAPAMNTSMYLHPVTQASLKRLSEMGIEILETASGVLACGETGFGKLLDPDPMLEEIKRRLLSGPQGPSLAEKPFKIKPAKRFRVLITSGGTLEPIDNVRVVTNISTGKTGAKLAELLANYGADVHLLRAETAAAAPLGIEQSTYDTFSSLREKLHELLRTQDFDLLIHAAAVSDFSIDSVEINGVQHQPGNFSKIQSQDRLTIHFKNNPKLVDEVKSQSRNKNLILIAFKLTSKFSEFEKDQAAHKLREHSKADFVIQNDTEEIDKTQDLHRFTLYGSSEKIPLQNIHTLASEIFQIFMKGKDS